MGKSVTPKYFVLVDGHLHMWSKNVGTTPEKLEAWVMKYAKSLESGGVNYHLSLSLGYIPYPNHVKVVLNDGSGQVVCEWKAAMFQAW